MMAVIYEVPRRMLHLPGGIIRYLLAAGGYISRSGSLRKENRHFEIIER